MPDLRLLGWLLPLCCLQSSPSPEPKKKKRRRSWKRSCWRRRRARSRPSPPGWASTWGRKSIYIIGGQYISSFAAANRKSDNIFLKIVFETVGIRCGTTCVVGGDRQHVTTVYALPNADCYSPPPPVSEVKLIITQHQNVAPSNSAREKEMTLKIGSRHF